MRRLIDNASVLEGLNSLTKFPSIPTLHVMGSQGRLGSEIGVELDLVDEQYVATEKVDGTNARVIFFPDGSYLVGSREELLWYSEDVIYNPALGIVKEFRRLSHRFEEFVLERGGGGLVCVYFEVYGHGIGKNGREYAADTDWTGSLVLDAAVWPGTSWWPLVSAPNAPEHLSRLRGEGRQPFLDWAEVVQVTRQLGYEHVPLRPMLELDWPTLEQARDYLESLPRSDAVIADGARGRAEGVVIRSTKGAALFSSSPVVRAKLRLEDYVRTLRVR